MLTALTVELIAFNDGVLPYNNGVLIHGLFLKLISEYNKKMSKELHDSTGFKPYTLSMLKGGEKRGRELIIKSGNKYAFRVTFLNKLLFTCFFETIYKYHKNNLNVKINNISFIISKVNLERNEKFEDLFHDSLISNNKFNLKFLSPTSFRVNGKNYLFPDTVHVLQSYFDKWNNFCPKDLKIEKGELELMIDYFYPVKHNLFTELLDMGTYKVVGFKGYCFYEIEKKIDIKILQKLNALMKFSKYSGTGYKTTMGMGQTIFSY